MADKQRVLAEVHHKVKSESDTSKFETGDIYDIASSERERELSLILGDRERAKLAEIEDALERIEDKSYGICEECGEPIGEHRLRALPFTRVCVDCKSRAEREELVKGRVVEEVGLGIAERAEIEEEEL
jgi:DnaK suppressor protein